jgi:thiamine biosynthesis lipoprotein
VQLLSFAAMASECKIYLDVSDEVETSLVAKQVEDEVLRIQNKFSRYRPDSVVSQINALAGSSAYSCDAETASLFNFAHQLHAQFDGVFDITTGVLRRAWDFSAQVLPSNDAVQALLPLVGWHQVLWDGQHIHLPCAGMEIDLGGLGKEYAVDRAANLLMQAGFKSALINFGGDVFAVGPKHDGAPWEVGIQHPRRPGHLIAVLPLKLGGMATSGDYERFMVVDGVRYSHLLNPITGWPVQHWQAISVLAPSCMLAGALSSAFMLSGERALSLLKSSGLRALCVNHASEVHSF